MTERMTKKNREKARASPNRKNREIESSQIRKKVQKKLISKKTKFAKKIHFERKTAISQSISRFDGIPQQQKRKKQNNKRKKSSSNGKRNRGNPKGTKTELRGVPSSANRRQTKANRIQRIGGGKSARHFDSRFAADSLMDGTSDSLMDEAPDSLMNESSLRRPQRHLRTGPATNSNCVTVDFDLSQGVA